MCTELTLSDHDVVIFLSLKVCSCDDPIGDLHKPRIWEACEYGRCSIRFLQFYDYIVN